MSFKLSQHLTFYNFALWGYKVFGPYFFHVFDAPPFVLDRCIDSVIFLDTLLETAYCPGCRITKTIFSTEKGEGADLIRGTPTRQEGGRKHQLQIYKAFKPNELRIADDDPEAIPRHGLTRIEDKRLGKKASEALSCLMAMDSQRDANPFERLRFRKLRDDLLIEPPTKAGLMEALAYKGAMALPHFGPRRALRLMNKLTNGNFARDTLNFFGSMDFYPAELWKNRMDRFLSDVPVEKQVRRMMRDVDYQYSKLSVSLDELEDLFPSDICDDNDA